MKIYRIAQNNDLWLLRHEYNKLDLNKEIIPKPALGAIDNFTKSAVYATDNKELAIAWGIMELGSDSSIDTSQTPLKMEVTNGKPRYGQQIYLYKMPSQKFTEMGNKEGWMCLEPVKPISEEVVNVNSYLHLIKEQNKNI